MSREEKKAATKFVIAEKFFGLLIAVIGALTTYYTYTSLEELSRITGAFGNIFALIGISLTALGLILIFAKTD